MGVPSFYRWLADKYPKTVVNAVEKTTEEDDGALPHPNGREFDNLYLDMNGIIHPCFHPEYDDILISYMNTPVTYEEVFNNVFEYIDRILKIVRPRKLLYMAIDGVAPRAKMNQQRTRRYRNAKDRQIFEKEEQRLRRQYESEGRAVLPNMESEVFDSNVITPGTEFMFELSKQLQTYIRQRITSNPLWKCLKVILSDAGAPGEGEHKIMSFIRHQRSCSGYNPNTSHVLYGLDADLIMLALATHELHFSILRENVFFEDHTKRSNSLVPFLGGESEASLVKRRGWFKQFDLNGGLEDTVKKMNDLEISTASRRKLMVKKPYQFLHLWILREYLNLDLKPTNLPEKFEADLERLIDDFIFICFFAGNDFLPHMPTLEIHEGAIDLLIHVYKEEFKKLGGYIVDVQRVDDKKGGYIKLKRVEKFILAVGAYEDKIFSKRSAIREKKLRRIPSDIEETESSTEIGTYIPKESEVHSSCSTISKSPDHVQILENTKTLKEQMKSYTRELSDVFRNGLVTDKVKLGSPGWRQRYYKCKFSAETDEDMEIIRKQVVEKYTKGLCWVLLYYFSGVPSWTWFFPYSYGPFASDFKGLSSTKIIFQKGLPFKPFDQLMAVLPPTSAHALPSPYRSLMSDEDSSILDFYPDDFDIDADGKRFLWQGICKLPFIEEERLLAATKNIEKELSVEDAKRNKEDADRLFVHSFMDFATKIMPIDTYADPIYQNCSIKIDASLSGDVFGFVRLKSENSCESKQLANNADVLCFNYDPPCSCLFIPRVLEGTIIPEPVVDESDIDQERSLWHESQGYPYPSTRPYRQVQGSTTNSSGVSFRNPQTNGIGSSWRSGSYGQHQGSTRSYSVGFRNSHPEIIMKGAGSGWSTVGRGGKVHEVPVSSQNGSWMSVHGSGNGQYRSTGYPARTNYNQNGQFWSVRADQSGGSSGNHGWNRWGDSRSRNASGEGNNGGRW